MTLSRARSTDDVGFGSAVLGDRYDTSVARATHLLSRHLRSLANEHLCGVWSSGLSRLFLPWDRGGRGWFR
jgi:hypothetical protein